MTFWRIFVRVFPWQPSAALGALWWYITGRKVRARNRLRAAGARLPFAYRFWMRNLEPLEDLHDGSVPLREGWAWEPAFCVALVTLPDDSELEVARSVASVEGQSYGRWTLLIIGSHTASHAPAIQDRVKFISHSAKLTTSDLVGDYLVIIRSGDELARSALYRYATALQAEPTAKFIYGDHDHLNATGERFDPWFKPRWNYELFLAQDYPSRAVAMNMDLVRDEILAGEIARASMPYELLLEIINRGGGAVVHVPCITAHLCSDSRISDQQSRIAAVSAHVAPHGATAGAGPFDTVKVCWPLPAQLPVVTIIVPTKDKVELLDACVASVLKKTSYPNYELLIIDNGSVKDATARYLSSIAKHHRVRVLPYPHPYNYSAINNFAASHARGSYLCLLNNDTEVVEESWLAEMMRQAVRSKIGAVGAKLLYADGSIQHAGVVVGMGDGAGHAHRNLPNSERGYFCQAHVTQFVSAVTGACLVVEKDKFLAVGGLDESCLAIAYNDVDLCLKLERAGWRNVYVPHAVLVHHESKSRPKDHLPSQIERYRKELKAFQDRWGAKLYEDPLFNPNLDRSSETFLIRL